MADLKQLVFFDFEMLCSNRGMLFEDMEAIRLGAVKYDIETEQISYFDRYIRPRNLQPLSNFCKKLTGIQDEDLVDAHLFKEVFADFLTWVGGIKRSRFFSWSKSDITRLELDGKAHQISTTTIDKIQKRYVDFQAIFTKRVTKTQFSVENALKLYDLPFIGEKHNPMYDAYNTLVIYLNFLKRPMKSDLIMLQQFILDTVPNDNTELNAHVRITLQKDIDNYVKELKDMYKMKDGHTIIKKTQRLVEKYENILMNRSSSFCPELIKSVRNLTEYYHELTFSYNEHNVHSSRIMILDEHLIKKVKRLALSS
ncbi:exonuclease domain-containing protein [Cytobacillus sp. FJAT-54145]|uniref:Exonuclease domain-containing protein n=1 Tax=Cytobacillus spartinae TaxID=3299023 RepID=A0ABW6K5F6_9BACI